LIAKQRARNTEVGAYDRAYYREHSDEITARRRVARVRGAAKRKLPGMTG
jgi:hypothetical protein